MFEASAARKPGQEKLGSCLGQEVFVRGDEKGHLTRLHAQLGTVQRAGAQNVPFRVSRSAQGAWITRARRTEKEASITPPTIGISVTRTAGDGWVPRKSLREGRCAQASARTRRRRASG